MIDFNKRLLTRMPTGGLVAPLLLACVLSGTAASPVLAQPRFSDSSWVAPTMPAEGVPALDGPRVASPDKARAWETVLRTPFRVVLMPFRLIGRGMELGVNSLAARYLEPEPKLTPRGPRLSVRLDVKGATTGVDNIGLGPAVSWDGFPTDEARIVASAAFSLNGRRRAQFQGWMRDKQPISFQLNGDYDFKPDRRYYGIGNDSPEAGLAYYRMENTKVEASTLFGASPLRQVRLQAGFSAIGPGTGDHASPLMDDVYPDGTVPFGGTATRYGIVGIAGDLAAPDDPLSPSLGVHGRVELQHAAGLRAVDPDYNQWLLEGRAYLPVFAKRRVLAFRAAYAGVDPTNGDSVLPFYRLVQSEGTLRFLGYPTQRFRDQQIILGHVEYRWVITHGLSAVANYQLGAVAPEMSAFSLRATHKSIGAGLRMGTLAGSAFRFDVGSSVEGVQAQLILRSDF